MSQVLYKLSDKRAEERIERLLKAVENLDRAVRLFVPDYPEDDQQPRKARELKLIEVDCHA